MILCNIIYEFPPELWRYKPHFLMAELQYGLSYAYIFVGNIVVWMYFNLYLITT